ncbi:hypothetical protein [Nostoc sp. FACHB-190]|nr:hypothetical protein [Nostoc sp. FACHB-190]
MVVLLTATNTEFVIGHLYLQRIKNKRPMKVSTRKLVRSPELVATA